MADEIKKDWREEDVEDWKKTVEKWRAIFKLAMPFSIIPFIISLFLPSPWKLVAWIIVLVPFVLWYGSHSFKQVKAWENGVVFFFGKLYGTPKKTSSRSLRGPGPRWIWWPAESIKFVKMYERKLDIPPQEVILGEQIAVELDGKKKANPIVIQVDPVFWFKVIGAVRSITAVEGVEDALTQLFVSTLRQKCAGKSLQTVIGSRDKIAKEVREDIEAELRGEEPKSTGKEKKDSEKNKEKQEEKKDEKQDEEKKRGWGVIVTKLGLQDVKPPKDIIDAMHRVYVADKARTEGIINADRERQQIQIAYPAITAQKSGLEIRTLQAWERASQGAGSTVVLAGLSSIMRSLLGHQGDGPLGGLRHPGRD